MKRKIFLIVVMVTLVLASTSITPAYGSPYVSETNVDFFWGYRYQGAVTAPALDLSSYATEVIRKAVGSDYSMSVYIGAGLTYDFSFGLHSPYQASIYLSDTSPRVKQSAAGHISLAPKNMYFDFSTSSKLSLKIGAKVFWGGVQIAGGEYPFDRSFSFSERIDTEYESPLGTYQVSVSQSIKDVMEKTVGKIVPKIELILGIGAGVVVAIPVDWDLDLVFKSYIDVTSSPGQRLSISPVTMTFNKPGALPFTMIPQSGGQDSVKWSFSQKMGMGIDFYIKGKIIADATMGVAASYESPWYGIKILSTDLVTPPTKTLSDVLSAQMSIPLPKLTTMLTSIDSKVKDTALKIFVGDESGASVSGAKVDVSTHQKSYSARDLDNGYYSVTIPTSELSSVQVSASRSGYEGVSTKIDVGAGYLQEYNSLQSEYTLLRSESESLQSSYKSLQSTYNSLKSDYDSLQIRQSSLQDDYNSLKSNYESLQANYNDLKSKYQMIGELGELGTTRSLMYIFIITTIVFMATTVYFARRKPKTI